MNPLTPQDALIDALTIEGLLFVAFSLAFTLAGGREGGRHPFFTQAWFGWLVFGVIAAVAASAFADWWSLFSGVAKHGWREYAQDYGLLVGIVAQPVFAAIINIAARSA